MRQIKFRGLSNNTWVYGLPFYSHGLGYWKIVKSNGWFPSYNNLDEGEMNDFIDVDANTIGQFTGLTDKNGKEIYEGDILDYWGGKDPVVFKDGAFQIKSTEFDFFDIPVDADIEVIGNIHQSKELINN